MRHFFRNKLWNALLVTTLFSSINFCNIQFTSAQCHKECDGHCSLTEKVHHHDEENGDHHEEKSEKDTTNGPCCSSLIASLSITKVLSPNELISFLPQMNFIKIFGNEDIKDKSSRFYFQSSLSPPMVFLRPALAHAPPFA